MFLQCGIVGLPNVGKSTLFNFLSHTKAQAAYFPFCTIEPNVRFDGDDVWLTQSQIALLFHTTRENVNQHIHHIYQKAELQKERTCKKFLQVQNEGSRTVQRNIAHYGMDMIVAVVYRVKSPAATHFRQWAMERRKQIINEKKQSEVIIIYESFSL